MMNVAYEEQIYSSYYLGSRRINEDEPTIYKNIFPGYSREGNPFCEPIFCQYSISIPPMKSIMTSEVIERNDWVEIR